MLLESKKMFSNGRDKFAIDYSFPITDVDFHGEKPFVSPITVKGEAVDGSGGIRLQVSCSFVFSMSCDRCARLAETRYTYSFTHVLVDNLENEDSDEYVELKKAPLDLDELLRADILLELPTKFLCQEDCKGLCTLCGKNLNDGPCSCNTQQIDPRLEVLKKLIE